MLKITRYLDRAEGVTDWVLLSWQTEATTVIRLPRLYNVRGDRLEPSPNPHPREVITSPGETVEVTAYSAFEADGAAWLGDSMGQITSNDEAAVKAIVDGLIAAARSQRNRPFSLPGRDEPYPDVALADPEIIDRSPAAVLEQAQRFSDLVIGETAHHQDVDVSNLEIFIRRDRCRVLSSRGIDVQFPATRIDAEICFLARPSSDRVGEHTARESVRRLSDLVSRKIVGTGAAMARDTALSGPPPQWQGPVVLAGGSAADFLLLQTNPLSFHASARMVFEKSARYEKGKPVSGDVPLRGEPLTIVSDPLVPYGLRSYRLADRDGTACRPVTVVRDGLYDGLLGQRRYFDYLGLIEKGVMPPGATGNTVVPAGPTKAADLLSGDCVVVRDFSAFSVDNASGQFSVEIRLGETRRSGEAAPFKGGLLVGNWFAAVADARYSKELQRYAGFQGPVAVRFGNLQIAG